MQDDFDGWVATPTFDEFQAIGYTGNDAMVIVRLWHYLSTEEKEALGFKNSDLLSAFQCLLASRNSSALTP